VNAAHIPPKAPPRGTSASASLELKVRLFGVDLAAARHVFWTHPRLAELFPSLLFRLYCETRATVGLLETAARRLESSPHHDPLAPGLIAYFREHIPQERGHDEWALDGLEALGVRRDEARARIPPPSVAAMVGAQYYWIRHHHPVALLGYIKVVEHQISDPRAIDRLCQQVGLPREAFALHLGHARVEAQHNHDLDALLDALPLTPADEALIGVSASTTMHHVAATLAEIIDLFARTAGPPGPKPVLV